MAELIRNRGKRKAPEVFRGDHEVYRSATERNLKRSRKKEHEGVFEPHIFPEKVLQESSLPEVCTVGYWNAAKNQDWGLDWHRNEGIEITYLSRGQLDYSIRDKCYNLQAGDLTMTRPWERHRVGDPYIQASCLHWLILDVGVRRPNEKWQWPGWVLLNKAERGRMEDMLRHSVNPVFAGNLEVESCFERIGKVIDAGTIEMVNTRIKILVNELLLALLGVMNQGRFQLDHGLASSQEAVKCFLEELPMHLQYLWTLDEMAKQCGLSRTRFSHYCLKLTNLTPTAFLIEARLNKAKELLMETDCQVAVIAERCGFQSAGYFAKKFREAIGATPRDYRSKQAPSSEE